MSSPRAIWHDDLLVLYRGRCEPMVRLAYLLTGNRSVAEEIVQDAFVACTATGTAPPRRAGTSAPRW